MAVAVKNSMETATPRPLNRLSVDSWLGVLYVLASLGTVFYGLPELWSGVASALGLTAAVKSALLILAMLLAVVGLFYLGIRLAGSNRPQGLSAGIFFGLMELLAIGLFTCSMGSFFERWFEGGTAGLVLTLVVGVGLCFVAVLFSFRPRFERLAVQTEEQGWFDIAAYKRTQGQRVRRGTILGILLLAGAGVWTLLHRNTLSAGGWVIRLPYTDGQTLTLLPNLKFTVPLLLGFLAFWLAYRVANFPVFADFLIATEAEVNKVSWTTRKRLFQDTVVVLVTVILLTVFLFVVDQLWALVLTQIGVLQITPPTGGTLAGRELPW
jgi:preprotein translocase SecE subunit